ncbi:MAG TPA: exosortase/archaeosortase family protein [Candidatus Didemnitutus sp.]|nr:exosortase/archaeosortase family protein [Candidatus Didemnitutus sp.]
MGQTPPSAQNPWKSWFSRPVVFISAPLAIASLAISFHLAPEWWRNPDLTHGFFVPVAFVLLLRAARGGPYRWLPSNAVTTLLRGAAALVAVALFAMAGLIAASLGWSHSLCDFLLAGALAAGLGAGLLILADDSVRFLPFNWAAVTACGIWILASPLPSGTYARVTYALQGEITGNVLEILHWLGIPATQRGNVLELATTTVGVAEACSGVRSLISCLFAGIFFAGWHVRRPGRRAVLIIAAPLLALLMNLFRSLALTLMANSGVNIEGFWHDATGIAVLGLTAVILFFLAERMARGKPGAAAESPTEPRTTSVRGALVGSFLGGIVSVIVLGLVFLFYGPSASESASTREARGFLPDAATGWEVAPSTSLYQFSDILRTTDLAQSTYVRTEAGRITQITVYVAHWNSGEAPVSLVASHTPDACWPGAGWTLENGSQVRSELAIDHHVLPPAEHRIFANATGQVQQVWFWHVYDGRVINYRDPYSVPALLSLALHYGFHRHGPQYFVRVSSNQSWDVLADEPLVRQIFGNLSRIGLKQ